MFKDVLKELRLSRNMNQSDLAKKINVSSSTIGMYEQGRRMPDDVILIRLSKLFNITIDYLLIGDQQKNSSEIAEEFKRKHSIDMSEMVLIPIIGNVQAGVNVFAIENLVGYHQIRKNTISKVEDYFILKVKGDSMYPTILENDLILVRQQTSVDSGDIAIVCIDGDEGVVKRVVYGEDWIELQSINPMYPVRRFEKEDVLKIYVLGKVVKIVERNL